MSSLDEESTAEAESDLAGVLRELRDEVEVLRIAIDELREEIQTAVRNVLHQSRDITRLTSMPSDPCTPNFGTQVNQVDAQQREELRREAVAIPTTEPTTTDRASPRVATPSPPPTNDPARPASAAPPSNHRTPTVTKESSQPVDEFAARGKRQPLYMRIYQQPLLTEIVRAIGYEQLAQGEVWRRLEPLAEKYGRERTLADARELVARLPGQHDLWALTDEARRSSRALLGPPPVEPACGIPVSGHNPLAKKPSDRETPTDDTPSTDKGAPVRASRKVVLARFRDHLASLRETIAEVDGEMLASLRQRGRMCPDLVIAGKPPLQLVALRRSLTKLQRHDMDQWLEVAGPDYEAIRVWPEKDKDSTEWMWVFECVAAPDDEEEGVEHAMDEADDWQTGEEASVE
jgi:hypothetical protein